VGLGNGWSVTSSCSSYPVSLRFNGAQDILIDPAGFGDNRGTLSDAAIRSGIACHLVDSGVTAVHCVLTFESIRSDNLRLPQTLAQSATIFGPTIENSTVVVMTKGDAVSQEENRIRSAEILRICRSRNIACVAWSNMAVGEEYNRQKRELIEAMERVRPYAMTEIGRITEKIRAEAERLERVTPKMTQEVPYTYTTEVQEPYTETISIPYQVLKEKDRGGIAGLLGGTKTYTETHYHSQVITKYKKKTEERTGQKTAEVPFPQGHFLAIAKKKVLSEIKQQYALQ